MPLETPTFERKQAYALRIFANTKVFYMCGPISNVSERAASQTIGAEFATHNISNYTCSTYPNAATHLPGLARRGVEW